MKKIALLLVFVSGCTYSVRLDEGELIDLTHTLESGMPIFPGGKDFKLTNMTDHTQGYYSNSFEMGEHTGTHVDAPCHFIKQRLSIDQIGPRRLITRCYKIDVVHLVKTEDFEVPANYIELWEAVQGKIERGSVVLFYTGWQSRWKNKDKYLNKSGDGSLHFPGISKEAAEMLRDRGVVGVGIDTLSVDRGISKDFVVHKILHDAGIYHIENLTNLDKVSPTGSILVVAPLKIKDGSGAPCRIFASVPKELTK